MSLTVAAIYAGATFASGTYANYLRKKGRLEGADERRRASNESLLTASYNIRERTKEGRQTQFQVLETGGNLARQIAIEGKRAEGAATVAGATSGALVETGSSRAVLSNIMQEAISAQTDAIIDTKNRIKSIARQTTNINTSEWRNAKLNKRQQNRIADRETKAAHREWLAGMINTGIKTFGAYKTASSWSKKTIDTDSSGKVTQTGKGYQHERSPVNVKRGPLDMARRGRPVKYKGYKNIHKKSRYSYGSTQAKGWSHSKSTAPWYKR